MQQEGIEHEFFEEGGIIPCTKEREDNYINYSSVFDVLLHSDGHFF
jgi:hypothetical protein